LKNIKKENVILTLIKKAAELESCKEIDPLHHLEEFKRELTSDLRKELAETKLKATEDQA
jgi:hypothetical protein